MKKFQIPQDIQLLVPGTNTKIVNEDKTERTVSFKEFISATVLADPRWVRDFAHVKAAFDIAKQLTQEEVVLDDVDHEKLKACVENPTNGFQGWHPAILPQLYPFMQAILEAK